MIPILYNKTETDFSHNGIGFLKDAIKCTVTEERNGSFECSFQYPITGQWYDKIANGFIIKAKANDTSEPQLFRIYKTSKPINGVVTYSAEHISYDLNGIPTLGLTVKSVSPQVAITKALDDAALPHNFSVLSDISTLNSTSIKTPCSVRAILGGQRGSVLDVWGGEYEFDNFTIKLHRHRGANNGVKIEYGKNLTDLKQEASIAECYTHLLPYVVYSIENDNGEKEDKYLYLSEKVLPFAIAENIGHQKAYIMDFTSHFAEDEELTEQNLRAKATAYASDAELGVPKVNLTVSFVPLWQTEEYKEIAPLERVNICDTVSVYFSKLGVTASAKVIKTTYNTLAEKYETIELGNAKSSFADTINNQQSQIEEIKTSIKDEQAKTTEEFKKAILAATNLITGQSGGYVVLNPAENPQEILILDTPTIEEAVNVWRWNSGGLGFSSTGYNGEFATAITMDGKMVADFITVGTLDGKVIKAESIKANAISADTFRIIFNTVSDYILFENGKIKAIDALNRVRASLGQDGLKIFKGSIIIYKGENEYSTPALKVDDSGNMALDGYLTRYGSPITMSVGYDEDFYHGVYIYSRKDFYKRTDGTYAPFIELWSSTDYNSVMTGIQNLRFAVRDVNPDSTSVYHRLSVDANGGQLNGNWQFGQEQNFKNNIGANAFKLFSGDTLIASLYNSTDNNPCLFSNNGNPILIGVNGNTRINANSQGGTLWGKWGIDRIDVRSNLVFKVDNTDVGYINWANDNDLYIGTNNSYPFVIGVGGSYRLKATSGGGLLYGKWDFGEEQFFSRTINVPAFICRKNGTGSKVMSLYISSTDNPCFNSDNGKDFFFVVGGNTKLAARSSGVDVYGNFEVTDSNNYYRIQTNNSGGNLWGTWYLGSSTAITSDAKKKNSVEELSEIYSTFFDLLKPIRYKYNDGTSDRYHTGFIAQDVEQALIDAEIPTTDFAGYVKTEDDNYYLRYEEFIAICVKETQKIKKENTDLKEKVSSLEEKLSALEAKINNILEKSEA